MRNSVKQLLFQFNLTKVKRIKRRNSFYLKLNHFFYKIKMKILYFILMCVSICLPPQTQQIVSQKFRMNLSKTSMRLDEILLDLNSLQQKLTSNTFTYEDIHLLGEAMEYILKARENMLNRKIKEQTVYWHSRQGR